MKNTNLKDLKPDTIEYIEKLENQVDRLTEMLRNAQKARFGRSSEKSRYVLEGNSEQLSLFNEAEATANKKEPEPVIVEKHVRKPKRTKEELAETLPVKEEVIELPESERKCDICEGELRPIGKEFVRREINIIPAQAYITEIYRENYACALCEKETEEANIVKAQVPEPVVKRGLASASAVAYVIYQKYVNSMPLYRQEKDWANNGVIISRATLANWIIYVSFMWLTPLYELLKSILLDTKVIHADETVVQVLKEEGKAPSSESRMWVYCSGNTGSPPVILFEYQPTRSGEHARRFLNGFGGFLQTDGYSGYNKVPEVTHCGCWAHLRRKYEEALPKTASKEGKALEGLEYCNQLFKLEKDFATLTPEERFEKRQELSRPVLDAYFAWLETVNPLQGSKLAQAITYSYNQKSPLSAFLLDGRIELSNNRAENAIRPFVVGRKNFLFCDTVRGAQSSAIIYSIIETAKANGLNVYQYLLYLMTELPTALTHCQSESERTNILVSFLPWADELPPQCRNANVFNTDIIQTTVTS